MSDQCFLLIVVIGIIIVIVIGIVIVIVHHPHLGGLYADAYQPSRPQAPYHKGLTFFASPPDPDQSHDMYSYTWTHGRAGGRPGGRAAGRTGGRTGGRRHGRAGGKTI